MTDIRILGGSTSSETERREQFLELMATSPIPSAETLSNLGLFLNRQTLSRIFFMQQLYEKIIDVHGCVMEFGVRWGQNLALFSNLRGIYEPYNYNRKIIGFDTFAGFPSIAEEDGASVAVSDYAVTEDYENYLSTVLAYLESESPISHKRKFELVKGDATKTIHEYIAEHPETVVALAYFDFDIYEPTKVCLEAIMPRVTRGSILAFDELNCPEFPGETIAVMESIGLSKYRIRRSPLNPLCSYIEIE